MSITQTTRHIKEQDYPILTIRIGRNVYIQKCIGYDDKEFEFELSDEVLDYTFNNAAISKSDTNSCTIECSEFVHPTFNCVPGMGDLLLFYYTKKDIRLRDICTTLHLKESINMGNFHIHLTQGLRNRATILMVNWITNGYLPAGAVLFIPLFIFFLWISYLVQALFKKIFIN